MSSVEVGKHYKEMNQHLQNSTGLCSEHTQCSSHVMFLEPYACVHSILSAPVAMGCASVGRSRVVRKICICPDHVPAFFSCHYSLYSTV
jgi:hypothetical protein